MGGDMMATRPPLAKERRESTALQEAIVSCEVTARPSRSLDAAIARAVFPALTLLAELEPGIWRYDDGSRARALNYTRSWTAAATLVPAGCWIEHDCDDVIINGPERAWRGAHDVAPIALCMAALRARTSVVHAAVHDPDIPKELQNDRKHRSRGRSRPAALPDHL